MGALLEAIGYGGWALHALIWLPVLGIGLVLWTDESEREEGRVLVVDRRLRPEPRDCGGRSTRPWPGMQMESVAPWIPAWGVSYALGHRRHLALHGAP